MYFYKALIKIFVLRKKNTILCLFKIAENEQNLRPKKVQLFVNAFLKIPPKIVKEKIILSTRVQAYGKAIKTLNLK